MTIWRVGMKAVCVKKDQWQPVDLAVRNDPKPAYGDVWTVSSVCIRGDEEYLTFCESHPRTLLFSEHFRPVASKPTDISIFKALLTNPHKQIERV